jgi:phosphodiesterase/alkaline phosphatase D-like protein
MNHAQFCSLRKWLSAPELRDLPKFIMSASALLPRRLIMQCAGHALESDAWDGYPSSLHALLEHICDNEIKGVVFLSGDEHVSSLVTAHISCEATGKRCTFHSVHSSSLFAPYPFANGSANDFIEQDAFEFNSQNTSGTRYRCTADTDFFAGDGFAVLSTWKESARWFVEINFNSGTGLKPNGKRTISLI